MSNNSTRPTQRLSLRLLIVIALLLGAIYFFGSDSPVGSVLNEIVQILLNEDVAPDAGEPSLRVETGGDWYQIYFTQPTCPDFEERVGGLDDDIAADLLNAQENVDIAAFDLDAEPIVNALIALEQRGLPVRIVTDSDNGDLSSIRRLRRNGLTVVEDERSALMHNKFIVIDGRFVWTGSLNFTSNGVYCNNNNLVRFDIPALAENYRTEMDEMYDARSFGPRSPAQTPHVWLTVGDVPVENYFAPERELVPILAEHIVQAQDEVLIMAFSFTNDVVGAAVLDRGAAGVAVRAVFETVGSTTEYSYYPQLVAANLPNIQARQDGNPSIMHHKVIIIDREVVVFGSFNFSNSANDSNDENIVILRDPAFAQAFVDEFARVWDEASEP